MHLSRLPDSLIVVLILHSVSAILTLILAIHDRYEPRIWAGWTVIGFITGPIGVVSRARVNRTNVGYAQIIQDMLLSLGLEFFATYVMPRFLRV